LGAAVLAVMPAQAQTNGRQTVSLDGVWEVGETVSSERPAHFDHRAPVPALTHSAIPSFPQVDEFVTPEHNVVKRLVGLPIDNQSFKGAGTAGNTRNYFWYRTRFDAPSPRGRARLEVLKAQFGSDVWVNGVPVGHNDSGFTAGEYDITKAIRWSANNEVVIRIGANPNVLSPGNTAIFDFEKTRWTPGIWDSVSLYFNDGVSITSTQVAPRISPREIVIQTQLKNTTPSAIRFNLAQSVQGLKDNTIIARSSRQLTLEPGEERTVAETISLPNAKLWSPGAPNLYIVRTSTGGDSTSTRFGLREFKFDTATKRAYLNGKPIFLRGGNIALHRFFDDPDSGTLPWDDAWVRKLLGPIPRKMHWNAVKFTIGPVPKRWLDIADEEGLLVLYEFPLWTLTPALTQGYKKELNATSLHEEYRAWLRDNWNHPSIIYWAASLESKLPDELAGKMIESVRKLDLSGRPWGNSWNPPAGPDDPYEFKQYVSADPRFNMTQLESEGGLRRGPFDPPTGHVGIITEFDWLWLNRDGSPTPYTKDVWSRIPYPHATAEERFQTQAYLLSGLIEYWRAHRNYAAVIYLAYLSQGWVVDNFQNVKDLTFRPHFEEYVSNAFKPIGVYINFWQPALEGGTDRSFDVMMINDDGTQSKGTISLVLEDQWGKQLATVSRPYALAAYGQTTYPLSIRMPAIEGQVVLKGIATPSAGAKDTTISRRFFKLVAKGAPTAAPPSGSSGQTTNSGGQSDAHH
jgi:hypothetical protein